MVKRLCALTIIVSGSAMAVAMMANWPPSIVGTWQGVANQSNVKLVITNQGQTGACKSISGTLSNVPSGGESNVQGFYCPATGRVSFVRKDIKSNATFQTYSADVSDVGPELRMAGTFAELNMADHLGEYNFAAQRRD